MGHAAEYTGNPASSCTAAGDPESVSGAALLKVTHMILGSLTRIVFTMFPSSCSGRGHHVTAVPGTTVTSGSQVDQPAVMGAARRMRTSPLVELALSAWASPCPASGASAASSSDVVVPLSELTSR